jgi:D-3-phosphoglycerate dehydrogenase
MLKGRVLGLVGCGRIGQWMARYAQAFGMRVLGTDPFLSVWPQTIEKLPLAELLASSDFISVHVPLTPETRAMLGRDELARAKRGAILVNTSRGAILDEAALLDALESGQLAAAGLDVLDGEPEVRAHPLRRYAETHTNLVITPHIAGFSPDAVRQVVVFTAERILRELGLA